VRGVIRDDVRGENEVAGDMSGKEAAGAEKADDVGVLAITLSKLGSSRAPSDVPAGVERVICLSQKRSAAGYCGRRHVAPGRQRGNGS
jgi:hypothetical protein